MSLAGLGATWERPGLGAGPAGRSFLLLAGTMPCWPCREQKAPAIQPTSAFPSTAPAERPLSGRTAPHGDWDCVVVQCRASWAWRVRWRSRERGLHTHHQVPCPCSKHRAPWFPQAEHIIHDSALPDGPHILASVPIPCILTLYPVI